MTNVFAELYETLLDIKNEEERVGRFRRREDFIDTIDFEDKIQIELREA
jgi:hypothetical protein